MTDAHTSPDTVYELKQCPFCGGQPELNIFYEDDTVNVPEPICDVEFAVVRCPCCGFSKQKRHAFEAAEWWNTRVGPAQARAELSIDELGGWIEHGLCYGISSKDGRTAARNLLAQFEIRPRATRMIEDTTKTILDIINEWSSVSPAQEPLAIPEVKLEYCEHGERAYCTICHMWDSVSRTPQAPIKTTEGGAS